jgi:hypothetical protein
LVSACSSVERSGWPDRLEADPPAAAGRDIAKGTTRNILAIIGMDAEEFQKLL